MPTDAAMRAAKAIIYSGYEDFPREEWATRMAEIIDREMGIANPPAPLQRSTMPIDGGKVHVWREWVASAGEYCLSKIDVVPDSGLSRQFSRWPPTKFLKIPPDLLLHKGCRCR